jgi:uncharacterized protein
MISHRLSLTVLPDHLAICRLGADCPIPTWTISASFVSVTRTSDELSIVSPEALVPKDIKAERDWRCMRVQGPLQFSLIGILASLVAPLAEAGIGILAISTFDTDYLLVRDKDLARAIDALRQMGHAVV